MEVADNMSEQPDPDDAGKIPNFLKWLLTADLIQQTGGHAAFVGTIFSGGSICLLSFNAALCFSLYVCVCVYANTESSSVTEHLSLSDHV